MKNKGYDIYYDRKFHQWCCAWKEGSASCAVWADTEEDVLKMYKEHEKK